MTMAEFLIDLKSSLPAAITTTGALGIVLWLCKGVISARLTTSIRHEYESKLASLQSNLNRQDDEYRAAIKSRMDQAEYIAKHALERSSRRDDLLLSKRADGIERIIVSIQAVKRASMACDMLATMNIENVEKEIKTNAKLQELFGFLAKMSDISNLQADECNTARPFVSPMCWALYAAYRSLICSASLYINFSAKGFGTEFIDKQAIVDLIKQAMPDKVDVLDKNGFGAAFYMHSAIEDRIYSEMRRMLEDPALDAKDVARADGILQASRQIDKTMAKAANEKG